MPSRPSTPPKSAGSARDDERAEKTTEILKKIRTLEIKTRGLVETVFAGNYHSVFKGRGMNFEDVREYQPGDEIRAIDWNVTARMGSAFVKKFTEERELTVMLVVDVSASGNFGSTTQSKRELAAEVACLLRSARFETTTRWACYCSPTASSFSFRRRRVVRTRCVSSEKFCFSNHRDVAQSPDWHLIISTKL